MPCEADLRERFGGFFRTLNTLADELSLQLLYLLRSSSTGGAKVELYLGLSAGRTDGNDVSCFVEKLEDVALGKAGFLRLVVVYDLGKRAAGNDLGRAGAVVRHNLLNLLCAGFALADDVDHLLYVQAVLLVDLLEELPQGEALLCSPSGAFRNRTACHLGALVTYEISQVEAVAFLTAADERRLSFLLLLNLCNVFECCCCSLYEFDAFL